MQHQKEKVPHINIHWLYTKMSARFCVSFFCYKILELISVNPSNKSPAYRNKHCFGKQLEVLFQQDLMRYVMVISIIILVWCFFLIFEKCAVRAATEGRILVLEGLEKAERNVLPVLNNLLENREMQLEDGRFLMSAERYDKLLQVQNHCLDFPLLFIPILGSSGTRLWRGEYVEAKWGKSHQGFYVFSGVLYRMKQAGWKLCEKSNYCLQQQKNDFLDVLSVHMKKGSSVLTLYEAWMFLKCESHNTRITKYTCGKRFKLKLFLWTSDNEVVIDLLLNF